MSFYIIPHIRKLDKEKLNSGIFLLVINADKQPPHLAICLNGKIFSLTTKGRQIGDPIEVFIRTINRNIIKSIFIEITPSVDFTAEKIIQMVETILLQYEKVEYGKITCLTPIKTLFNNVYSVDTGKVNYIFDLLPQLYLMKLINSVYHLNLENELKGEDYFFKTYTMKDINSRIGFLVE